MKFFWSGAGQISIGCQVFAKGTPELIEMLIERCWRENPNERLSFKQIGIELKEIHKALSDREKTWLSAIYGHPVYEVPTTLNVPNNTKCGGLMTARSLTRHPVFEPSHRSRPSLCIPRPSSAKKEKKKKFSLFKKKWNCKYPYHGPIPDLFHPFSGYHHPF